MLSTDTDSDNKDEKGNTPVSNACFRVSAKQVLIWDQKVTITTVHAAKGLEWPVIFIPAGMSASSCARWVESERT